MEDDINNQLSPGDFICDLTAAVFNDTTIAFQNNGGIRSSFPVGNITYEDVLEVLPFDNTVDKVTMNGAGLKMSLENAAASINYTDLSEYPGFGFQVAGLRFTIIVEPHNQNSRIKDLEVLNVDGSYSDLNETAIYNVALPSFLAGGGEKNQRQTRGIFDDGIIDHTPGDTILFEAARNYIKDKSIIHQVRIQSSRGSLIKC